MKVLGLTPCLMLDNNRGINNKCFRNNKENIMLDNWCVYAQMFTDNDKFKDVTYIGNKQERMGFVIPRNELLKYFYNSDYDYAFWIDANSTVSKPTLNDVNTIIKLMQSSNDFLECDAIFSTLGMWVSHERMFVKSLPDALENVHILPNPRNKSYNWMHGLFLKNFKKYYGLELYIDDRCDVSKGTPEDVFFARLLNQVMATYVAPGIVINKPSSNFSTHQNSGSGKYDYAPVDFNLVDRYVWEYIRVNSLPNKRQNRLINEIITPRCDSKLSLVKAFKPRTKNVQADKKPRLFDIS